MKQFRGTAVHAAWSSRGGRPSDHTEMTVAHDVPGFGPLTAIDTDFGRVPAQALRVRDRVRVRSGRFCPIARIDRLLLDEGFLDSNPHAQPVLIAPGKLGCGLPVESVLLAPGQMLSHGQRLQTSFSTARDLLRAGLAHRRFEPFLTYVVFSFQEPEDVCAAGLWLRVEPDAMRCDDGED